MDNNQPDAFDLLQVVSTALRRHASKDVFAIGGKIDVETLQTTSSVNQGPIVIRWDSRKGGQGRKVSLPVPGDEMSSRDFQQLLMDCQPATFGKGNAEVLDEEYRKAGKMDVTEFCTNFNLARHGIVDTVTQALVHSAFEEEVERNGVRAELYKLNIYSGPSGKFKSHVDTPRSENQMGSLVVCLPSPHQGGALAVRHGGQEVLFDWSSKDSDSIQWAAFFSDCEHEVFEVTDGHRVTLTYNLYWTSYGPSLMATHLSALNQSSFHFYAALEKLVKSPSFLPNGGHIGFTCTHGYPHSSPAAIPHLNPMLKGLDMIVYQALKRLLHHTGVLAVLDGSHYEQWRDDHEMTDSDDSTPSDNGTADPHATNVYLSDFLCAPIVWERYTEETSLDPESVTHSVTRDNETTWHRERVFPKERVTWLNGDPRSFKELAVAFMTYGNEPGIDAYYSAAVIVSCLPTYDQRK
ncbi:hypothetical protein P152DRAFT_407734 [Eremomyces bilateralis CBS 781.70]|uniref:Fe2OG dioxygenase domain-containing protein n=1 Tax=Eremomyces bilateralis CBS 781.70 TaxID=1392243 RepID=A0A6G1GGM7_9PEZI|nr:uncharacterized protein P152DRAFT_407734 [Eremomyces bilateralis CBS 781.70]KAF1817255.1 hypothetical protein P152DRAFT_407734 [Eremomyces bilateralis CBS 781.70]